MIKKALFESGPCKPDTKNSATVRVVCPFCKLIHSHVLSGKEYSELISNDGCFPAESKCVETAKEYLSKAKDQQYLISYR